MGNPPPLFTLPNYWPSVRPWNKKELLSELSPMCEFVNFNALSIVSLCFYNKIALLMNVPVAWFGPLVNPNGQVFVDV